MAPRPQRNRRHRRGAANFSRARGSRRGFAATGPGTYESFVRSGLRSSKQQYQAFLKQSPRSSLAHMADVVSQIRRPRGTQLARYLVWLRPHAAALASLFVLALLTIAIDMMWPLASVYLVDDIVLAKDLEPEEKLTQIVGVAALMAAAVGAGAGLGWWRAVRLQLVSARLAFRLRQRVFQQVLRLPLSALHEMKTGGILSRLSTDVDATTSLLQQALISPLLALVRLLVTLGIVLSLNVKVALVMVLILPPVMLVQAGRAGRMRPIWRSMSQDRQEIDGRVSEGLGGVRVVRAFRREKREERAYMAGHHTVIRKQVLATTIQRRIATVWELILPVSQLAVLSVGGYLVIHGETTVGTLFAFQGYLYKLFDPILQLASSLSVTQRGLAAMDRVFELLDLPRDLPDRAGATPAREPVGEVRLESVGFQYRPGVPVLHDIDLVAPAGATIALVGASGAGKTTLTDLIARFFDPTSGRVLLDGVDLRDLELQSYRSLLGVVSQDVFLFDGTVHDNIAYARPEATEEEVREAARGANADEFIEKLVEGYETWIGERGVKLSGGQRQRISIARALLAAPQILILDEATSNLDTESEQKIQQALRRLLQGRTTFVVAHRLSTVAHADQIVVLHEGRIAEQGTHEQLLQRGGRYAAMLERQRQAQDDDATAVRVSFEAIS